MRGDKDKIIAQIMEEIKERKTRYREYVREAKIINGNPILKEILEPKFNSNTSDMEIYKDED